MADPTSSHNEPAAATATPGSSESAAENAAAEDRPTGSRTPRTSRARRSQAGNEDMVALGARIPRALDNKLAGLLYRLRLQNVRVSKAELVALALEDLPDEPTAALIERLS